MFIPYYMTFYIAVAGMLVFGLIVSLILEKISTGRYPTGIMFMMITLVFCINPIIEGISTQQQDGKTTTIQVTEINRDNSSIELNDEYLVDKDTKIDVGDKLTLQYDANTNHWDLVDK